MMKMLPHTTSSPTGVFFNLTVLMKLFGKLAIFYFIFVFFFLGKHHFYFMPIHAINFVNLWQILVLKIYL